MNRIVLLHATPVAMAPIHAAFNEVWPEAEAINLLDDGLSVDRAREKGLSLALTDRFVRLGEYGFSMQAQGILVTCSAFGPAIDRLSATLPVPVHKPNEAMFMEAVAQGKNIGMLATFGPAVETMTDEFDEYVSQHDSQAKLTTILVDDAIDLLKKGDAESHNRLVAARAKELAHCDVIMLAHFSTSRAAESVREQVAIPVLTAPHAAVKRMKASVLAAAKE
ncbi:arylsulfatase [Kalamiella sp. sgz302252]|uniref:arylsulfatase n=1 Tax=Pantoea sp. sgz302252 TaxID=3341827 RepID=UPI0036D42B48